VETGFLDRTVQVAGATRRYAVFVPLGYRPERPPPAILFLHGRGESGVDGLLQVSQGLGPAVLRARDRWPFLIVFPQKPNANSQWSTHHEMLGEVLAQVDREWPSNPCRRYLTGLSQGGCGTFELAGRLPWSFAAAAPVCGYCETSEVPSHLEGLPLWVFHGERDETVPAAESVRVVEELRRLGHSPRLSLYPDLEHNSWDRAYRDEAIPEWFLEHRLPDT
jgi:predicted peptidase